MFNEKQSAGTYFDKIHKKTALVVVLVRAHSDTVGSLLRCRGVIHSPFVQRHVAENSIPAAHWLRRSRSISIELQLNVFSVTAVLPVAEKSIGFAFDLTKVVVQRQKIKGRHMDFVVEQGLQACRGIF